MPTVRETTKDTSQTSQGTREDWRMVVDAYKGDVFQNGILQRVDDYKQVIVSGKVKASNIVSNGTSYTGTPGTIVSTPFQVTAGYSKFVNLGFIEDSPRGSAAPLVIVGANSKALFINCTFRRTTTSLICAQVEALGRASFIGCIFEGPTPVLIQNWAAAGDVSVIGCLNATTSVFAGITDFGSI